MKYIASVLILSFAFSQSAHAGFVLNAEEYLKEHPEKIEKGKNFIKMGIKKSNAIGRGAIVAGEAIGAKKAVKEVVVHGYGYVKHYIFHV